MRARKFFSIVSTMARTEPSMFRPSTAITSSAPAYKIFSPHMGFLWGRREMLQKSADLSRRFHSGRTAGKD